MSAGTGTGARCRSSTASRPNANRHASSKSTRELIEQRAQQRENGVLHERERQNALVRLQARSARPLRFETTPETAVPWRARGQCPCRAFGQASPGSTRVQATTVTISDGECHPRTRSVKTRRKREMLSPALLRASHRASILLMIHPEQMQHTVKHQNLDLFRDSVAEFGRLFCGPLGGNRDLARKSAGRT